jgi:hypothetical protein
MSTFRRHMPKEDVAIALEDKPKNEDKLPRQKARRGAGIKALIPRFDALPCDFAAIAKQSAVA